MFAACDAALTAAGSNLQRRGFSRINERTWEGSLPCGPQSNIKIRLSVPSHFPYELPAIFINRADLPHRIPHVEESGKICIAPTTSFLIDVNRPEDVIDDALERAAEILKAGVAKTNEADLIEEFIAYWNHGVQDGVCSISPPSRESRRLFTFTVNDWAGIKNSRTLVADSKTIADEWAIAFGKKISPLPASFLVVLQTPFPPPDFGEMYAIESLLALIRQHASPPTVDILNQWFEQTTTPVNVLLSIPIGAMGPAVIGVRINSLTGQAAKLAEKGWGAGRISTSRTIHFGQQAKVSRLFVERLDHEFLIPRGGGDSTFHEKTVAVIGCGSIGSHIVRQLAEMGVGKLRLIDNQDLKPENIHRHILGMDIVNHNKAVALKVILGRSFPHLKIEARDQSIQQVLQEESSFITDADLICVAVGDETLEIMLNRHLRFVKPRIHVWAEPLGIGQHVLLTGMGNSKGCYECLFKKDNTFGLVNAAAFAHPGQTFHKSLAGCGGSFISFSANDSVQACVETTSLASECLSATISTSVLVSRFGNSSIFLSEGYKLSRRANLFSSRQVIREHNFAASDCIVCG